MAKKKIGIYTNLESTSNNKVEDLYLIVDKESILFSVKNKVSNQIVAFEHFVNSPDNIGWHQLVAYLQNNSKLIHCIFGNIYFVWNSARFVLTKQINHGNSLMYQQELDFVHGVSTDEELYFTPYDENLAVVFSVPDTLNTLLSRSFPTGKWHHYSEYVLATEANNDALVYLFENSIVLRLVKEGRTQFIKYFSLEGSDQNSYHILNACINTQLDLKNSNLKVWGWDAQQHEFINQIAPYFNAFEIMDAPNNAVGASLNNNYPQHIYSTYFIF